LCDRTIFGMNSQQPASVPN